MAIIYPENREEISNRIKTDVQNYIPESDPFLRASWLWSLIIAISNVDFDIYKTIANLQIELFPDTATGIFAERWGNFKGIEKGAATQASGLVTATGTATTLIPQNTGVQTKSGVQYLTQQDATISAHVIGISSLTRSGTTALAVTADIHHLTTGMTVTIAGADQAEYNGAFEIVAVGTSQFEYQVTGSPVTPATGTITVSADFASIEILAEDFGVATNLSGSTPMTFVSPIAGVDQDLAVQYNGLTGGKDEQANADYRLEYLDAYQNPVANFNDAAIIAEAKKINGVTRVFVEDATPTAGQVTIYFMRDNDDNPIPNSQAVQDVKNQILTIKPAEMESVDVIVSGPTGITVDFDFAIINPNTTTMKEAITNSLIQFFKESTEVGVNIPEDGYRCAIYSTYDMATGEFLTSFALNSPTGDIAISDGEIGIFGNITFA